MWFIDKKFETTKYKIQKLFFIKKKNIIRITERKRQRKRERLNSGTKS